MRVFLVSVLAVLVANSAPAALPNIPAAWSSIAGGAINGVSFTVDGLGAGAALDLDDYSGSNYAASPLGTMQTMVDYHESTTTITITFAQPVSDLLLYTSGWRGNGTSTYALSAPFTILSGEATATQSGNSLVNVSDFADGILYFAGPLTTLTISHPVLSNGSFQGFDLAIAFPPPQLSVSISGKKKLATTAGHRVLKGTAAVMHGTLARVEVQVGRKAFRPALGTSDWKFTAKLQPGKNKILVRAVDQSGAASPTAAVTITRE